MQKYSKDAAGEPTMLRSIIGLVVLLALTSTAQAGYVAYQFTGAPQQFIVPTGVTAVNVLAIGGGGGGANGHQGGGGAGYLVTGTFTVAPGAIIPITVGAGGLGALDANSSNAIVGLTAGGTSMFGAFMTAGGGGIVTGINQGGHNGSSGGGAACNSGSPGGDGGSGGSNGQACQSGYSMPIGSGQGSYASLLALFTENILSAGAGGAGGTGSHAGGGGAGGILISGLGLIAGAGNAFFSGQGGVGYGAGGGAGGLDTSINNIRYGGGDGAGGLVYVEFLDAVPAPEPSTMAIFGLGLAAVGFARRKRLV
ncbi:MAG: PEP-CTERM sorting domain-containing protein [Alphaproteobacteria bacterium]|jgi:hypothetical protein|nr:PEP-CTERM sorting domain-containing protein [Alphaproteobacteria bacterium]MDP6816110.1 PEP-CTERM sorting domain-containing protein [Alphaproteobacteria bacterium]